MANLQFEINLSGNFASALEHSSKGLDEAGKHASHARKEFELFESELGKMKAGALGINFNAIAEGGHFFTFDLAEGAKLAYEAIEKVVDKVIEFGAEMIKSAAAAEDLNLAVKLDVGDKAGEKVDQLAESFASTRFNAKSIKEALLPILEESGTKNESLWDDLATAATDVATRRNTGIAGAKQALVALNDIELNPQRLRGSLKELGIKQLDFYQDLGNLLGISAKAAEDQTKAGRVKAQTLLSVALNQIAQREGGALGNATNQGAKTLGTSLERLDHLSENLFERLAGSPGLKALQGFLDNFINTMEGPIGQELVAKVSDAFQTMFGDLSGPDGLAKVEAAAKSMADQIKSGIDDFRNAWPDIKTGATAVWDVIKEIAREVAKVVEGWREIHGFYKDLKSGRVFKDIGDTIRGDTGGIAGDAVNDNSPEWKKRRALGQVPAMADGGVVDRPTLALIGEAGPEAVIPLGSSRAAGSIGAVSGAAGGGRGSMSVQIGDLHYHGTSTGSPDEAHEFAQRLRIEVKKMLDEVGMTVGATAI